MSSLNRYIIPIVRNNSGCDYHRIIMPFAMMGCNTNVQGSIEHARLVVFNRLPHITNDKFFQIQRRTGMKYVIDIDDHWILDKSHHLYKSFQEGKVSERIEELIRKANAVTVTTAELADEVKALNSNIHVIPNALPYDLGQFCIGRRPTEYKTRFVYAGGSSHYHDLKLISGMLKDVSIAIAGNNPVSSESKKISRLVPTSKTINILPLTRYMECYEHADASLAPLVDNVFNRCKSNLKVLEAGAKGLSIIASKIPPYLNSLDEKFVDYASNDFEWSHLIRYYHENPGYVFDRGAALADHVRKNYQLQVINKYRTDLYYHLLSV